MRFLLNPSNLVITSDPLLPPCTGHRRLLRALQEHVLAFESLVSSHYPKLDNEREIDWLRRALKSASAALRLDGLRVFTDRRPRRFNCRFNSSSGPTKMLGSLSFTQRRAATISLPRFFFRPRGRLSRSCPSNPDSHAHGRGLVSTPAERAAASSSVGCTKNARKMLAESSAYASSYDGPFDASERDLSHLRFQTAAKLQTRLAPSFSVAANLRSFPLPVSRAVSGQPRAAR